MLNESTVSFEQFRMMIADHFGIEANRLAWKTSFFDDLGVDSLSLINFIVKLEKSHNIRIEMDTVWNLKNVGEAYEILVNKLKERRSVAPNEYGKDLA